MGNRQARLDRQHEREMRVALEESMNEAPLPIGWEEALTEKGNTYYINHLERVTTFVDPRLNKKKKKKGKNPPKYVHDFYSRVQNFISRLHQIKTDDGPSLDINVRRESVLEDSFERLYNLDDYTLTRRLSVKFEGEQGLDFGGMSREWLTDLSQVILNEKYNLFRSAGPYFYVINYRADKSPNYLENFHFAGILMGLAVYHNKLFHTYFVPAFYKALLNQPIVVEDLKALDENLYNNFKLFSETENIENLSITFSVRENEEEIELKPGGSDIEVTEDNKSEYIDLCLKYYLGLPQDPINAIREGIYKFIPPEMLAEWNCEELEKLLGGNSVIDFMDLQENTEYQDEYSPDHQVIKNFWAALSEFTQDILKRFLHFTTGSEKVPVGGFSHLHGSKGLQKFTIKPLNSNGLPVAHSCFNRLELPRYSTLEDLKIKLMYAITETEGFGIE